MWSALRRKSWTGFAGGLGIGLVLGLGRLLGAWATHDGQTPQLILPQNLQATATHGSENFAIATGRVSEDTEGIFFLEFLTGELTCSVIYPRTGNFGAQFRTNVTRDLGAQRRRNPNYIMVTGESMVSTGNVGAIRPSPCVVYVVDTNSGGFACYRVPWNRQLANSGQPQQGAIRLNNKGVASKLGAQRVGSPDRKKKKQ